MNRLAVNLLLAAAVAIGASWIVTDGSTESYRAQLGLTMAPFGRPRMLMVHLLASLPLALVLARAATGRLSTNEVEFWTVGWLVAGFFVALGAFLFAPAFGTLFTDAPFLARAGARSIWCLALELPWCLALVRTIAARRSFVPGWIDLALAFAVSFGLPAVYALRVADDESKQLAELLERGRILKARASLEAIRDVGTGEPVGAAPLRELQKQLDREIALSLELANRPLPRSASLDLRLERELRLAMIGQTEEAERKLRPLAASDLSAKRILALVLQEREGWDESCSLNREVLEGYINQASGNAQALKMCVGCFDDLAYNARASGHFTTAEAVYFEALDRLPVSAAAHFHFRLGQQYYQAGRPASAIEQLRHASQLDPASYGKQASKMIDELRRNTPACVLK